MKRGRMKETFVDFGLLNPSLFIYYQCVKNTWTYTSFVHLFVLYTFCLDFYLFWHKTKIPIMRSPCSCQPEGIHHFLKSPAGAD